jgi:cell division protein FtsA
MSQSQIVAAIDLGTSKVVVLLAQISPDKELNILGVGQASALGMRKGEIMDMTAACRCAHAALQAAEKNARVAAEVAFLSQSGAHLDGFYHTASVTVSGSDNRVRPVDVQRLLAEARKKELPAERVAICHIRNPYKLDGRFVVEPNNLEGEKLEVGFWSVTGEESRLGNAIHLVNGYNGLAVKDLIVSSVASANVVTPEAEKKIGALVLDIGAGSTDYALYRLGHIICTGVVPVGGDHLTNDLSHGLRINRRHAEKVKLSFGQALVDAQARAEKVWMVGDKTVGDRYIPRLAICQIIEARVEELLSIIKTRLGSLLTPEDTAAGVILTGGTSRLPGLDKTVERVLGLPARRATEPAWLTDTLRGPEYSTAVGLLLYALSSPDRVGVQKSSGKSGGVLAQIARIFGLS